MFETKNGTPSREVAAPYKDTDEGKEVQSVNGGGLQTMSIDKQDRSWQNLSLFVMYLVILLGELLLLHLYTTVSCMDSMFLDVLPPGIWSGIQRFWELLLLYLCNCCNVCWSKTTQECMQCVTMTRMDRRK